MSISDPPGPPEHLKAEDITKTSCTLTWKPPSFDGGSPVTGYIVEKSTGSRWIKVNREPIADCHLSFTDLEEGMEYEFRVCAVNEAGVSKPSDTTGRFIAKDPFDPPGKPGQPEVTEITKDSATFVWEAPEDDGGAEIFNYVIEMRSSSDRKWHVISKGETVPETTYTMKNVVEETEYEFRVSAENKAGTGPPSAPSEPAKYGKCLTQMLQYSLYFILFSCNQNLSKFLSFYVHFEIADMSPLLHHAWESH